MADTIVVTNPNATQAVTDGIDAAMAPLRLDGGPAIHCVTLAEGPPAIETDEEIEAVVAPLRRGIAADDEAELTAPIERLERRLAEPGRA